MTATMTLEPDMEMAAISGLSRMTIFETQSVGGEQPDSRAADFRTHVLPQRGEARDLDLRGPSRGHRHSCPGMIRARRAPWRGLSATLLTLVVIGVILQRNMRSLRVTSR